jgi:hypothetical protein
LLYGHNQRFFSQPRFPKSRRKPKILFPFEKLCYRTKKNQMNLNFMNKVK